MFYQLEHVGTTGYFTKEEGENFTYPPHMHQSFELILLEEGEMSVSVDGKEYLLQKGGAVLIFPNQIHSMHSILSKHTLFIFSPRVVQSFFVEKSGTLPHCSAFSVPSNLLATLKRLQKDSSKYALKGALYTVCALFDQSAQYVDALSEKQDLLYRIFAYVDQNFKGDCTLETLAEEIGYNADYISRFFKKKVGLAYNKYLNARRLNHAAYLLTNTGESCLYCALESGYTSLRSFNRNFKEQFGISPTEYKKGL